MKSSNSIVTTAKDRIVTAEEVLTARGRNGEYKSRDSVRLHNGIWHFRHADLDFTYEHTGDSFRILFGFAEKVRYAIAEHDGYDDETMDDFLDRIYDICLCVIPELKDFKFDELYPHEYMDTDEYVRYYFGNTGWKNRGLLASFLRDRNVTLEDFLLNQKYWVVIDRTGKEFDEYAENGIINSENVADRYFSSF